MRKLNRGRIASGTAAVVVPLVLWAIAAVPISAQARGASGASSRSSPPAKKGALLIRGTERVKGLPGFAANAFAAIYGEYRMEGTLASVSVWATQDPLYFDPLVWTPRSVGDVPAFSRTLGPEANPLGDGPDTGSGSFVLIATELPVSGWTVVASLPADELTPGEIEGFFKLFLERFSHFLAASKLPTDVSFPATLGG